jgi:asparagine synthase (glutamine-hydrolysing)
MGAWLKKELSAVVRELLSPAVVCQRGLFRHEAVSLLLADHEANRSDGTDALLALLNLEIWSRVYLDGREPGAVAEELKALAGAAPRPMAHVPEPA